LGDLIEIRDLAVRSEDATLSVSVAYLVRRTGEIVESTFQRSGG
jgi:hypothetical protein